MSECSPQWQEASLFGQELKNNVEVKLCFLDLPSTDCSVLLFFCPNFMKYFSRLNKLKTKYISSS